MEYPGDAFHTFLGLDSAIYKAVNGTVTSLPVFIQNILKLLTNKAFTGSEQHGDIPLRCIMGNGVVLQCVLRCIMGNGVVLQCF